MVENKSPIVMGCDHAALGLKEEIIALLKERAIPVQDAGTHSLDSVDYPDYGIKVAAMVASGEFERGILICGTGLGMSMTANRFAGVRAALCPDLFSAAMSRKHNDANILVLGARVTGVGLALEIVKTWLDTPFEGGRHQLRIDKFNLLGTPAERKTP
ncbi:MAG: ribose 5-phosphate isomerase B [Proteobacteria bacterium]|nr:ribose 5-phosphate isomerase B [Pseudomonadota bacterium]MBU4469749.1 ribose 5-phosphate isomerase B [Pseudomonadota bacterium]MCG2753871.1 ribose 5-phosphate isomerase B [Desulfobacteraceae bacterium]